MKFFIDTADVSEIRESQAMGLLDGVTTNPSLVAKTGRKFEDVLVEIGGAEIDGLSRTFADSDGLLALAGSHGYLEIAERNGNAARRLDIGIGGKLRIVLSATGPPENP